MDRHRSRPNNRRIASGDARHPTSDEHLSRFLAFVLRHHPEEIGLTLDDQGWADLDPLLEGVHTRRGFEAVTREHVERLLETLGAARFELQGGRVRARYGHTLPQAIRYEPSTPPAGLFHGTTPEAVEQILADGLRAGDRQRVHLSVDTPAAREVGQRRCPDPVIFRVDTAAARRAGVAFYHAGPTVWLSDDVPPQYITRVE